MSKKSTRSVIRLAQLSVLVALLILFSFTGIGYLKVGAVEITLNVIPVAVGAVVLGPAPGAVLGSVFGITSFIQCFGLSAFGAAILAVSPVKAFITCFFPRLLIGLLTGLIYKALQNKKIGNPVASLCCPLLNTVLFVGTFLLLFRSSDYFVTLSEAAGTNNILNFVAWFVGLNGAVEAVACFVVATAVSAALLKVNRKLH